MRGHPQLQRRHLCPPGRLCWCRSARARCQQAAQAAARVGQQAAAAEGHHLVDVGQRLLCLRAAVEDGWRQRVAWAQRPLVRAANQQRQLASAAQDAVRCPPRAQRGCAPARGPAGTAGLPGRQPPAPPRQPGPPTRRAASRRRQRRWSERCSGRRRRNRRWARAPARPARPPAAGALPPWRRRRARAPPASAVPPLQRLRRRSSRHALGLAALLGLAQRRCSNSRGCAREAALVGDRQPAAVGAWLGEGCCQAAPVGRRMRSACAVVGLFTCSLKWATNSGPSRASAALAGPPPCAGARRAAAQAGSKSRRRSLEPGATSQQLSYAPADAAAAQAAARRALLGRGIA